MKDDEVECSVDFLYFPEENKFKLWWVKDRRRMGVQPSVDRGPWLKWEVAPSFDPEGVLYNPTDFPEIIQDRIALLMMNGEGEVVGVGRNIRDITICEGTKGALCRINVSLTPEEFTQIEEDYK